MHSVDEQLQRRWFDAKTPIGGNVLHQLQGASAEFPCRQNFWSDRREGEVGSQYRHLQQNAAGTLSVDQQQIIMSAKCGQQIAQPQPTIRCM